MEGKNKKSPAPDPDPGPGQGQKVPKYEIPKYRTMNLGLDRGRENIPPGPGHGPVSRSRYDSQAAWKADKSKDAPEVAGRGRGGWRSDMNRFGPGDTEGSWRPGGRGGDTDTGTGRSEPTTHWRGGRGRGYFSGGGAESGTRGTFSSRGGRGRGSGRTWEPNTNTGYHGRGNRGGRGSTQGHSHPR
jgi:hypothetical protein